VSRIQGAPAPQVLRFDDATPDPISPTDRNGDSPQNLSVPGRSVTDMSNDIDTKSIETHTETLSTDAFTDPVAYLAAFGIVANLVDETSLAVAA